MFTTTLLDIAYAVVGPIRGVAKFKNKPAAIAQRERVKLLGNFNSFDDESVIRKLAV